MLEYICSGSNFEVALEHNTLLMNIEHCLLTAVHILEHAHCAHYTANIIPALRFLSTFSTDKTTNTTTTLFRILKWSL